MGAAFVLVLLCAICALCAFCVARCAALQKEINVLAKTVGDLARLQAGAAPAAPAVPSADADALMDYLKSLQVDTDGLAG